MLGLLQYGKRAVRAMSGLLQAVKDTAAMRRAVDADLEDAMRRARQEGHTLAAIGEAAGITRQAVHYRLSRPDISGSLREERNNAEDSV